MERNIQDLVSKIKEIEFAFSAKEGAKTISSVEYDSRKVSKGSLFVAVEGFSVDGHNFVDAAIKNGAIAILISSKRVNEFSHLVEEQINVLVSNDTRKALAQISAAFYDFPSKKMKLIGITGTNGKTSATYMIESILKTCGKSVGVIGTINTRWKDKSFVSSNTTPESRDLQKTLFEMQKDDVQYVVMEVSSHALVLDRVNSIEFDAIAFTNLTGDHLDFHKDMEDYFNAKKMLFDLLSESGKEKKAALVNIDDSYGMKIFDERSKYPYTLDGFGLNENAKYRADENSVQNKISGLSYALKSPFDGAKINMQMVGGFQLYNSLTVLSVLSSMNISIADIQNGLASLTGVPGRFDVVRSDVEIPVIVDYAHTSDALDKLLNSVSEMRTGRIITVFGCGGDRDKTKRPVMGKIASLNSDQVVVTSDNPRTEDPNAIIADITAGIDKNNYIVIADRKKAIEEAVSMATHGDIVVIAGKGHEDYQILGKEKIHFDDHEEARKALAMRNKN